nr:AMP-binding protein [Gordonia hydrophobica]
MITTAPLTVGDIVVDNATRFPDQAAYIAGERVRTHRELYDRARSLAAALESRGVHRSDRVAVYGRNSIEFGEVLAMGQISGIVVATVNFRLSPVEVTSILADSTPRVLFVDADLLTTVADRLPDDIEVVCLDPSAGVPPQGVPTFDEFVTCTSEEPVSRARATDIACLIYTSGTTGRPKGCIVGQDGLREIAFILTNEMRLGSQDRQLLVMPMFHIGAMAIGLAAHARGATVVLHRGFDTAETLQSVVDHGITALHLAPTMLQELVRAARDSPAALRGIRVVVYSAAPITADNLAAAMAAMPDAGFTNMYGQTEVITSGLPFEFHDRDGSALAERRLSSVGLPFPGNRVRIVDDAGHEVPTGESGEIIVWSATAFRGYWNNSAATADTLRDGWCHTGDVGVLDDDGLLHIVDRKKDVVISGGENVYSLEVEDAISDHPDVAECAVIGTPDDRWGEAVTGIIVSQAGTEFDPDALRSFLRDRLAAYKIPKRFFPVPELPKMATGKIDKKALRVEFSRPAE